METPLLSEIEHMDNIFNEESGRVFSKNSVKLSFPTTIVFENTDTISYSADIARFEGRLERNKLCKHQLRVVRHPKIFEKIIQACDNIGTSQETGD